MVGTNKTPVLLAFGKHGRQGDKRFFRENVGSFIDKRIIKEQREGAIIYELLLYPRVPSAPQTPEQMKYALERKGNYRRKFESELEDLETRINEDWMETRDRGNPFMKRSLNWGFENQVMGINLHSPGKITHKIEPQRADVAYADWVMTLDADKLILPGYDHSRMVEDLVDFIPKLIEYQVLRGKHVKSLVDKLREENPERAIIIPRGTAHKGMRHLFSPEEYDVTFADSGYQLDFTDALLASSYARMPSQNKIRQTAVLQAHYIDYWNANSVRLIQPLLKIVGLQNIAERKIEEGARQYALAKVSK